jgi:hypothetical protein
VKRIRKNARNIACLLQYLASLSALDKLVRMYVNGRITLKEYTSVTNVLGCTSTIFLVADPKQLTHYTPQIKGSFLLLLLILLLFHLLHHGSF